MFCLIQGTKVERNGHRLKYLKPWAQINLSSFKSSLHFSGIFFTVREKWWPHQLRIYLICSTMSLLLWIGTQAHTKIQKPTLLCTKLTSKFLKLNLFVYFCNRNWKNNLCYSIPERSICKNIWKTFINEIQKSYIMEANYIYPESSILTFIRST